MKNFEQNFDKAMNCLREINEILKECNLEMQKALGETKAIQYAIFEPETEMYLAKHETKISATKLRNAKLFDSVPIANEHKTWLENTYQVKLEIKIIQLKVVE